MNEPVAMAEVWRGAFLECVHAGHAVIANDRGEVIEAWGEPDLAVLPRSSCKMFQALPLVESGAADAYGLGDDQLALACASHTGAAIHTERVEAWLTDLGLGEADLRCGPQMPGDRPARTELIRAGRQPCQIHNNCSGKHSGFLTLGKHLGAGPEYVEPDHPVQRAVLEAYEDITRRESLGHAIDGCSAPNFATTLTGLATGMAFFATATDGGSSRQRAARRLYEAMVGHPDLVSGEGETCTELMRAGGGRVAVKTGAEGVYAAIVPERGVGVAVKIVDGATRGSQMAIAALLAHLGVLDPAHPAVATRLNAVQRNRRKLEVGVARPAAGFPV